MSWHTTSYFDFAVLWDLLLSTVCGLHFFSYLEHAFSQHSNFSQNKVQKSLKQREGGKEWHKKPWLEFLRTATERAQMLLIPAPLPPEPATRSSKFTSPACTVCARVLQTHGEHQKDILQDNCLSRLTSAQSQMKCKCEQLTSRPEKSALLLQTAMSYNCVNLVYLISKLLFPLSCTTVSGITRWWHLRSRGNDLIAFPGKS